MKKNILFITAHPAQIHNFRILKDKLEERGHKVFWLSTDKDISLYLLNYYSINYSLIKRSKTSTISKISALFKNMFTIWRFIIKNNVSLVISRPAYASLASFMARCPNILLADTESSDKLHKFFCLFTNAFLTATSFKNKLRSDQIYYDANIELFYLHPNHFQPQSRKEVSKILGIEDEDPYIIMRFVSWGAYHDKGLNGFSDKNKIKVVKAFLPYAKVFISSENKLPEALEPYSISIPPERMHNVLAHTKLFFGESATMASESAVLGRPAIYLNENWLGYTDDAEKHGLLNSFKQNENSQQAAIQKGVDLLSSNSLESSLENTHKEFMKNKIDVTGFFVWFVENYPESYNTMIENPDYQYRFK